MASLKSDEEIVSEKVVSGLSTLVILAVLVIGALIIFWQVIWSVPAGFSGVIYSGTDGVKPISYNEGWHFKVPFLEQAYTVDCRVIKIDTKASAGSKDLQTVTSDVALNYHVDRTKAWVLYKDIGMDYETRVIAPAIEESIRAVTAKYTAEELITRREEVSMQVRELITQKMVNFNILVDAFNIVNFDFSPEFNNAIEQKQVAEQEAQRESNVLTKVKIQAQQKIAEAEGVKQSTILRAQGDANATIINADAQAKSIQLQADALKANPQLIELKRVQQWDGKLPSFMMSGQNPMIMDVSKVVQ